MSSTIHSEEFNLDAKKILLKLHENKELKEIYKKVVKKKPTRGLSHFDLIREIANKTSIKDLVQEYASTIFAKNTTIKNYRVIRENGNPIVRGFNQLKTTFNTDEWVKLTNEGLKPRDLSDKAKLMFILKKANKAYFLFALPGQKKEIVEGLKIKKVLQPIFTIAAWNDVSSYLEIRGKDGRKLVLDFFDKKLSKAFNENIGFNHIRIDDQERLLKFKKLVNGRERRGRFRNSEREIEDITMISQVDKELSETEKYDNLQDEDYLQTATGIDFTFETKPYTVWIGLTTGSVWIRTGDVEESVLDYLRSNLIKAYS